MFAKESLIPADRCTICPQNEDLTYISLWPDWLRGNPNILRTTNPFESVVTAPQNYIPVCSDDFHFITDACEASYFNQNDKAKLKQLFKPEGGFPEGDAFSLACTVLTVPLIDPDGLTRNHRDAMTNIHTGFVEATLKLPELQRELGLSNRTVESFIKAGFVVAENAPKLLIPKKKGTGRFAYLQSDIG